MTPQDRSAARGELEKIYFSAVAAVHPRRLVPHLVFCTDEGWGVRDPAGRGEWKVESNAKAMVFGAGKGAASVAAVLEESLGARIAGGLVIVPDGYEAKLERVEQRVASHPLPDERGENATRALLAKIAGLPLDTPVIVIITGGASSLLVAPASGIPLGEKVALTQALLGSGAEIGEINAVRKHLSSVKGGQLGRLLGRRPCLTLVVSDVMGDDPAVVGSGPTVPDRTTFADAVGVLRRYGLWERAGEAVRAHLSRGLAGKVKDTPKRPSATTRGAQRRRLLVTLATNHTAREGAVRAGLARGFQVLDMGCCLSGDTAASAWEFARAVAAKVGGLPRGCSPLLMIAGGETTVEVRGRGLGGRNQEFALAAAEALAALPQVVLLSAGTDGIDGPTDAAGAFVDGTTLARAGALGLDWRVFLSQNDSYRFFGALGDLFRPGPTGVNVMDLKLVLALHPSG